MKKPSLQEFLKKGIVKKEKEGYYYIANGAPDYLSNHHAAAYQRALKRFQSENMDNPAGHSLPSKSSKEDGSIQNLPENNLDAVEAELNMLVGVYKGRSSGGDLDIFVDGVNSRERGSSKYPASHLVNRIPTKFCWKKRKEIVKNGSEYKAGNIHVLSRYEIGLLQKHYNVEIKRDDTPDCDYITVGELVLCGINHSDWDKEQLKKSFEGSIAPTKHLNARNERARQLSAIADSNPNGIQESIKSYQSDRETHITEATQSQHASEYLERPDTEIREEISKSMSSDLSEDEMKKIQEQLLENSIPVQI